MTDANKGNEFREEESDDNGEDNNRLRLRLVRTRCDHVTGCAFKFAIYAIYAMCFSLYFVLFCS